MGGYRVDPAALGEADAWLGDCASQAQHELATLHAAAGDLLRAWRGDGGAAFSAAWDDWQAGAHALLVALGDLARVIGVSGRDYATTEDAVRTSMAAS